MFAKYVTVDGVPLHYFYTGPSTLPGTPPALARGELVLCVHGAGSNAHTWHRQLAHLERAHSAVALDFPGHGRSGATAGLADLDAHARCLDGFAAALGLRPAVVIGRALGGAAAVALAQAHPARVRALVLVATPPRFVIPPASLEVWHAVTMGRATQPFDLRLFAAGADPAVVRECFLEQVKTDPRVRYGDLRAGDGIDLTAALAALRVPVLVATGREDHFCPPEQAAAAQALVPGARLAVIEGAGHMLTSEQPDAFHAALDAFLAELPR